MNREPEKVEDVETKENVSDKELNFSRLREKTKRLEMEALEQKKRADELQAMRDKDRRELEELRARQEELAIEAALVDDDLDPPDELVVSGKLKEKHKKLAEKQAHVLQKQIKQTKQEIEAAFEKQNELHRRELGKALAERDLTRLFSTYGEEEVGAEIEGNPHLKKVLSLLDDPAEKASYLVDHFSGKEKAKKLLDNSNRQNAEPINTGIGSGLVGRGDMIERRKSISAKDLTNIESLKEFNDSVLQQLGIGQKPKA